MLKTCTTEDIFLMRYYSFLFTQDSDVSPCILDITGFRVLPRIFRKPPPIYRYFTKTLRLLDDFRLLTVIEQHIDIFGKPFASLKQTLRQSVEFLLVNLYTFFPGFRVFIPELHLCCLFPTAATFFRFL
jgi:hypothetical protein